MNKYYEEIIISSGGIKGIALIGALNIFVKKYPIERIKYYTGCSVGAFICFLLNLNYTINELNDIVFKINFGIFQDLKIVNLFEKCGFDEGYKFTNFLKAIIINKNYNPNITFKELYDKTGKILTIAVTNITKGIPEYHNYINTPNLNVLISLRMSTNIPIIFTPILYNNNYYVDGALLDPFPYNYIKNIHKDQKYGLWLFEKYEFDFLKNNNVCFINELTGSLIYTMNILKIIYINYIKKFYKKIPKNVVYINFEMNSINLENFEVSIENKKKMFEIGMKKCNTFFYKKYKSIRKFKLIKRYFNKWKKII